MVRATERMKVVVPVTLAIIFVLLYATLRRWDEALLIMGTLPFALTGGMWLLYLLGYNQSVATEVGFIALAGVAAEFGVVMLIYLKHALDERDDGDVAAAVREGVLLRVRPKAMTMAVILAGLMPIMVGSGAGSEVMNRIAAPMVGGMLDEDSAKGSGDHVRQKPLAIGDMTNVRRTTVTEARRVKNGGCG